MRIDLSTCRDPDLLAAEVRRLRAAIAALAEQDATLSMVGGEVIVEMDATLTDAEREAVVYFAQWGTWAAAAAHAATLRGLLERAGCKDHGPRS
jgi:hypothetical protein